MNSPVKTEVCTNISDIRQKIKDFKKKNLVIGFVPTMGALHIGHESLIKKAKDECDAVIVSVFVNPTQFCPGEDFEKYPRQLEADRALCSALGVDLIFAPNSEEMYPEGKNSLTEVVPPASFQDELCGISRKGHFNGVATVVLKLFNIVNPDKAYFGQKDAQQLIIIKKMVRDLNVDVEVIACPTIRDADGLACSSRNKYLDENSKEKAFSINKSLKKIQELHYAGENSAVYSIEEAKKILDQDLEVEYYEAIDIKTFEKTKKIKEDTLIAVAVKVKGKGVRLIDNLII